MFSVIVLTGTAQFLHHHHRSDIHGSDDPADPAIEGELQYQDARLRRLGCIRRRPHTPLVHCDGWRRKYHGQGKFGTLAGTSRYLATNACDRFQPVKPE